MPADKRTPEYMAWQNMIQRCTNDRSKQYKDYGGRGITVFPGWVGRGGFKLFLVEVGPRPSSEHTLDRIDNDKGYDPVNVRWATRTVQNRNTSKNVVMALDNVSKTMAEWSLQTGIPRSTLNYRRKAGWSPERILGHA